MSQNQTELEWYHTSINIFKHTYGHKYCLHLAMKSWYKYSTDIHRINTLKKWSIKLARVRNRSRDYCTPDCCPTTEHFCQYLCLLFFTNKPSCGKSSAIYWSVMDGRTTIDKFYYSNNLQHILKHMYPNICWSY